jgi:hypothetical protein
MNPGPGGRVCEAGTGLAASMMTTRLSSEAIVGRVPTMRFDQLHLTWGWSS